VPYPISQQDSFRLEFSAPCRGVAVLGDWTPARSLIAGAISFCLLIFVRLGCLGFGLFGQNFHPPKMVGFCFQPQGFDFGLR
jgi:hypothetical protein